MFLAIYTFCFALSLVVIFYDYTLGGSYRKFSSYLWLVGASLLEPFLYHPLIVFFSLKGYCDYIVQTKAVWGVMTRKGSDNKVKGEEKVAAA